MEYWGQVPVRVRIDDVDFTTALFPKDGRYLVPLKVAVRRAVGVEPSQTVRLRLDVVRSLVWLSVRDKLLVANPGYLDRFEE